jgi:hypothetical protein
MLIHDLEEGMVRTREGSTISKSANRHDHLVVEADPDDRSFLYMQDQHCYDDI